MARVRKSVWGLKATDQTLVWYERAVDAMKKKPCTDPTSWRYQAAIHEYRDGEDPLFDPEDPLPGDAEQKKFWNRCQHSSWYFLPWHRMYLHHFEQIVAAEVVKAGGPKDWALPYWNYSDASDANARKLPEPFRKAKKADGSDNALFVADREPAANAGKDTFMTDEDVALADTLAPTDFASSPQALGFGGPETAFHHKSGPIGSLEGTPHGSIHVAVGGWMGDFNTAGLDPIFWLHHCNIDRLWQVWLERDKNNQNPKKDWPTKPKFWFRDLDGKAMTMVAGDVVDTTAAPLSYSYEDTSDPLAATPLIPHITVAAAGTTVKKKKKRPEMIGATSKPFKISSAVTHATFAAKKTASMKPAVMGIEAGPAPRVFLNIEKIVSKERAPSYDVYLEVPDEQKPEDNPHLFVGRMAMFGLRESSEKTASTPGAGLNYVFDITNLYRHISKLPGWDPDNLKVSFVPARGKPPADVTVGRVSLYFQ